MPCSVGQPLYNQIWQTLPHVVDVSALSICIVLRAFHHHRFIVRFPIGLDFPLITLPFQGC